MNYAKGIIYILKVMDHAEYDKTLWVGECGCHKPPPKRPAAAAESPSEGGPPARIRKGRE